ncbi:hypothetical protein GCM10027343_19850 [Noviherbaspirillum agri]
MKQHWQRISAKIDALTLRERVIIFGMAALIVIVLVNVAILDPQTAKQKQLSESIKQDQAKIAALHAEMQQMARAQSIDPDQDNKTRLQQLQQQAQQIRSKVEGMQSGFISPEKMSLLLEDILRQNAQLRLLSLKKLPPSRLNEPAMAAKSTAAATAGSAAQDGLVAVYRHGVEIVVEGGYLDLLSYLSQLEAMPWQLFWGGTKLEVTEYPKATLTLTLFTLSLDKQWLNI